MWNRVPLKHDVSNIEEVNIVSTRAGFVWFGFAWLICTGRGGGATHVRCSDDRLIRTSRVIN